jgi:hypothetical protein
MAVKTMDELARRHLQAVDNFIASLTPQQRELVKVGALRDDQCTPHQQSLADEMVRTTPRGLTPAQATEYTRRCQEEETREHCQKEFQRGWEEGGKQVNMAKWIAFAFGCCIAILILLSHC